MAYISKDVGKVFRRKSKSQRGIKCVYCREKIKKNEKFVVLEDRTYVHIGTFCGTAMHSRTKKVKNCYFDMLKGE